jgi:sterol desaturase/sphingolipid hydroxylase (fatty acid hydroxylase superfamily)
MSFAVATAAFWALVAATFWPRHRRAGLTARQPRDWLLDVTGLLVQGLLVPLAAAWLLHPAWRGLAPGWADVVTLPGWVSFAVCFVGVDYLYYWNHRLLHTAALWPLHRVHHTLPVLDVVGTSRNSLWTSAFIVYVWATSLAQYVLADPAPYLAAVTATAILDLWRHSPLHPPPAVARWLRGWLVLPRDHGWHHAGDGEHGNYGANLILWDRVHGTHRAGADLPGALGVPRAGTVTDELLRPWALP